MAILLPSVLNDALRQLDDAAVHKAFEVLKKNFSSTTQARITGTKEIALQGEFIELFFDAVLGYVRFPWDGWHIQREFTSETSNERADAAIARNSDMQHVIGVIELKGTDTHDLKSVEKQVFTYFHQHPNCHYAITSNYQSVRLYIDNNQGYEEFNIFGIVNNNDYERFRYLYCYLHRDAILGTRTQELREKTVIKEQKITYELYELYKKLRIQLHTDLKAYNRTVNPYLLYQKTQKLLDRFLFILFAEDKDLLPRFTVKTHINQWIQDGRKGTLMQVFQTMFKELNVGNPAKNFFAYNGGLFAPDAVIDSLVLQGNVLETYLLYLEKYDYKTEVDVRIFGHIFEQSLNDLEEMRTLAEGGTIEKSKSKRKKDGVFYTPQYITRYIVAHTLGALCETQRTAFGVIEGKKASLVSLNAYRKWLLGVTVLDPACGSGAFLSEVLTFLLAEHEAIDERVAGAQAKPVVYNDYSTHILENNIFGVDLNDEAVEIAKLSLWLRTAQQGKKLTNLNPHLKAGNSLIDDPKITDKPFNWQKEFPTVFKNGGFDVVVGNPPYVDIKALDNDVVKYLFKNYDTTENRINLYAVFIEKGYNLLKKDNSYLSYINPNSILMNSSYSKIRSLLKQDVTRIIKLPDNVFPDAKVETIIFELQKNSCSKSAEVIVYTKNEVIKEVDDKLSKKINKKEWNDTFSIYASDANLVLEKCRQDTIPLSDLVDFTLGITPYDKYKGHSESLIKNREFHADKKLDKTYMPLITGENITRYYLSPNISEYIKYGNWLGAKREERFFTEPRILIRQIISGNPGRIFATYTADDFYFTQIGFGIIIKNKNKLSEKYLLSIINSKLINFYHKYQFLDVEKNLFQKILIANCKQFPIKPISPKQQAPFIALADTMLALHADLQAERLGIVAHLQAVFGTKILVNKKITDWSAATWHDLQRELQKQKCILLPKQETATRQAFDAAHARVAALNRTIAATDAKIDTLVYALYDLTDAEIDLIAL